MTNTWLFRGAPHGSYQVDNFIDNNFIAVGYPVGESFENLNYEEIHNKLSEFGWEEGIGNVYSLVTLFNINDYVIVPSNNKKDVYLGKITSDYLYKKKFDEDKAGSGFPHQRSVSWLFDKKPILRSKLPEEVRASLRYPGTVADLTKHTHLIEEIINEQSSSIEDHNKIELKAIKVIAELLDSDNEELKFKAAQFVIENKKHFVTVK
ncbi:hypothetical protein [Vagococcus fluvialis]|uniref:hypothetical protein n=1 Tax=Vagococcus fluvialis TaxID=2738 RepID=UPI003B5A4B4B